MKALRWIGVLVGCCALAAPTSAQPTDSLVDRWEIRVGAFFPSYDTDIRFDANDLDLGTSIDLENALGLDESDEILRFTVGYRISRRHQIRIGYYDFSREASNQIAFDIEFGDVVFPVDAVVDSDFDAQLMDIRYAYWPVLKEKTAFAVVGGLVTWDIDLKLAVGESRFEGQLSSEAKIDEFVPEIGVEVRQAITPRLVFRAAVNGIFFDLGDSEGEIVEIGLGIEHKTWKHAGIGVVFNAVDADVDDFGDRFTGTYELTITGLQLYVPIRF